MKKALQVLGFVLLPFLLSAQTGKEFWLAPPDVTLKHNQPGDEPIYLNVTAGANAAVVTVTQPANSGFNGGSPIVINVPAYSSVRHNLTSLKAQLETRPTNTVKNTGLRISSTQDITCYYELSNTNNPDIIALKGANSLGTEFYIPLHKHAPFKNHDFGDANNKAFASFDIVATQNNTTVLIYSPVAVDGHPALVPFTITLNRGQAYSCAWTGSDYVNPSTHPSGAAVLSDKPIAITIKDDSNHNPGGGCYDLMMDQIVPIGILGTEYVAVKGSLYSNGDESVFLMAVENNTKIYINGNATPVATLFAGQYYRHDMDYLSGSSTENSAYMTSSKPVYAVHVTGFGCEQGMALLPPLNCAGSQQVGFTRSTSEGFFLNVLVRTGSEGDFVVTGGTATISPSQFKTVPGTGGAWKSAHIEFNTTQVPVNSGMLIRNTSDVFSLGVINGGAGSGCRYGFFSEFAGKVEVDAGPDQTLCAGESAQLNGSVTGGSITGVWTTTGTGVFLPNANAQNAVYEPSLSDIALGTITLRLTSTGQCTPDFDEMTLTLQPKPKAEAGPEMFVCTNAPVVSLAGEIQDAVGGLWSGGAGSFAPNTSDLNATYTPTADEIDDGEVMLYLETIGNGVCAAHKDSVLVNFTPAPTVNAGADQTLCSNNPVASLNGVVTVATGGVWSGGDGDFDPSITNLHATYTPTADEIATGQVTLTLTGTGSGNCAVVSDQVKLTFTAGPTANAGANSSVCANNADIQLNGSVTVATGGVWSGGLGQFDPDNNTLNAVYTPTGTEIANGSVILTLTTTGNGNCFSATSQRTITFTAAPIVDAGPNGTVCANAPLINLNGSVTGATGGQWSGGSGSFSNINSLTSTYTPNAAEITAGTVTLTLTSTGNGTCSPVVDQVTYTITPAPTVHAGADQTVCGNNAEVTLNGSYTVATGAVWSGAGSFDPSITNMQAKYMPTADEINAGTATITLTTTGNGLCNAVSDQMVLTITAAPTANAGANSSVCANNADIQLNGSVTVATGGVWSGGLGQFDPDNNTLNAVYTPTGTEIANGSVTLTLTTTGHGSCLPVTSQRTITFTPAPIVDAGPNGTVCANAPLINLNGTVTGATGGQWSGGSGSFSNINSLTSTYTPNAAEITAGTVTLTLTSIGNGTCNPVIDQVTYTITPAPTVNAGADKTVCGNNAEVTLNGSYTVATGAVWSGAGSFDPSITNMQAKYMPTADEINAGTATITLTTTGNGLCNAVSDQMVLTITAAPTANAGANSSVCANNADIQLNGSVTVAGGGVWSGGLGQYDPDNSTLNAVYTPTAMELAAGQVTLTLTTTGNGSCLPATSQRTITFTPAPIVNAGADASVCANAPVISLSGSVIGATGGQWSGGSGSFSNINSLTSTYTPSAAEITAGTVTLTLTSAGNGNCNAVSDQVTFTITPAPTVTAGADQNICSNNPVATLAGGYTIATGAVWTGGAGVFTPGPTSMTATYTATATEVANGAVTLTLTTTGNGLCTAVNDQMTLHFTTAPTANAGPAVSVCANNPNVPLGGSVSVASGGIWSGGNGSYNPNNTTLNAVYTPTPAEINAGILTLTLTTTGNDNCLAVTSQKTITFTPAPVVNAGSNGTVCANMPAITLNGSVAGATGGKWTGGAGTFYPDNTTLNATYTPTATERSNGTVTLTLTSTGNGNCNAVSDQVTFTITPAPTVHAGADQNICSNNAVATLSGSFTLATGVVWSGGAGTFSPGATSANATYTPTATEIANGSVTLTLTTTGNNNCLAVSDQVVLHFTPSPVVNAGPDVTRCVNNANVTLNGSVSVATGGVWSGGAGSYNPNNATLNAVYTPTPAELAGGILTLTLTSTGNDNCNAVSDDMVINFTPAPIVDAGPNSSVCANMSAMPLNGSVTGAGGGIWSGGNGTYYPNNSTMNAVYTPTAAERAGGTVTLTLTSAGNGLCSAVSDQVTWTITPAPTVNAGADQNLCSNNPVATLNGSYTVASGAVWSGGNGTFSPSPFNMNATYTPTADEIAAGSVTLELATTGNVNCLAVSDQVVLHFTPSPVVNAGTDATVCMNNAAVALNGTVTVASGGIWSGGAGSFTPNNTTLNATYSPTPAELAAGSLTLTLTSTGNGNCVSVSDSKTITFTPAPVVDAGLNGTVCANNSAIVLNGTVTGASGGIWSGGTGTYNPNSGTLNATYTPSAAERTAGSVTLTLTSAGNGNCSAVSDQVSFSITPAPTANAGPDRVLCANNPAATLAGAFTVATGGVWSGGNGTFDPSTTNMSAVYTPTAAEIANGSVTLTLTTTGNGLCTAVTDDVLLTFTDGPSANAGPDVTVCANNAAVALNGSVIVATGGTWSGGSGIFSPNPSTLNATYTPSAADLAAGSVTLILTTTGNGTCAPAVDTRVITYTPAPIVNAGTDGTVCANLPAISLNGSVTGAAGGVWSGGSGSFNPNSITLNAIYTPSQAEIDAGEVILTLTSAGNGLCSPVTDQVRFTITPAPTVSAGADQSLCANNADAVLNAAITVATGVQWSGGAGLYSPGSTAQNITYSPSPIELANGSVTLTATTTGNGNCAQVSDNVVLTFTPAPIANAGPDQTVSANNPATTLAGSFTVATGIHWSGGTGTYNPNANTANAVYTPSQSEINAGSVMLTMTTTGNGACGAVSDEMTIFFSDAPTADAGPDQTVCANNPLVTLNGSITVATGGQWSTSGTGNFTPNNQTLNATYHPSAADITAGGVTITLTTTGNGNSLPVTDQMVLTITPAPTVNAGADLTVCANQPVAQLAGVVHNAGGGVWSGGLGSFDPSANNLNATYTPTLGEINTGTITLTLTSTDNGLCNAVSDQVVIHVAPAPVVNAGVDQTVCSNNASVQLAGSVQNATGGIWSGGTGGFSPSINALNAVYTPSQTELANGSVTLTLTSTGNGSCLEVSDALTIYFTQSPTANAGVDRTVCANDPTVQLNGAVTIASGGMWSGGTGTYSPDANTLNAVYHPSPAEVALGTATLTLTTTQNGLCNAVSDEMVITIMASPVANAGNDISVCANNAQVQLGASVTGAGGGQWSGGAGTFVPSIADLNAIYYPTQDEIDAGTLTLTLTTIGNGHCVPVSDQVMITFTASPTADAGLDGMRCANNASIQLNGNVTVANGGTWSGGGGTFWPDAHALNAVYMPSQGEIAAGSATLTLTTTGNHGCTAVSDQVVYTFTPAPTANAGPDVFSCANNAAVDLSGSVTVGTGGLWSGGNGSFSPNAGSLEVTYTPTQAEIDAGSVILTLTTVGNGLCNAESDNVLLTITPAPIVDAGLPLQSCANNPAVQLAGSVQYASGGIWSGAGSFSPDETVLNAVYTPTPAEVAAGTATITLTSTGNGLCHGVSDQVVLTITQAPVVEAGAAMTLCANNVAAQLNGQVLNATGGKWTGGAGSFSPNSSTLNAIYTASASEIADGEVWLYLTSTGNGGCFASEDSVLLQFTPAPTVDAGINAKVCANDADVALNGVVTVAGGGLWSGGDGTFSPNANTLNATYTPSALEIVAGEVNLVLTTTGNGNCLAVSDSITITVVPVPVVNAGPNQDICANNPVLQLNGFVGNAPGGEWTGGNGTYFPSNTALALQYTPTQAEIDAGSITFTLTSTGTTTCAPVSHSMTVTFTDAPVVDAGGTVEICANNPVVQLHGDVEHASGGKWTGGNGTFSPSNIVLSPTYTPTAGEIASGALDLYLTSTGNGNCIAVQDTLHVIFTSAPTVSAGLDQNLCYNNPTVQLDGSYTVANGVQWSGGLGTYTPNAQDPQAEYTPSTFELQTGQVELTLTTTGNDNCIAVSDQVVLTVTPAPVVDAGPDVTVCSSELQIPLDGSITGGATAGKWMTLGSGSFMPNPNTLAATYIASSLDSLYGSVELVLLSTDNGLCQTVSDTMVITILPAATAHAGPDQSICASEATAQLAGSISGNATEGHWTTTGGGSFLPNASDPDAVYQLAPSDAALGTLTFTWSVNSCNNASDQMVLTIVPLSTVSAGTDQVVCFNNPNVVLNGIVGGASITGAWTTLGSGTFLNGPNALANIYHPSAADSLALGVDLVLTATNTGACQASADTIHIEILPSGSVDAGPDLSFCANNATVQLNGTNSGQATQIQWTTSGTGVFYPNANVLTPTYVPSAIDTAMGTLTLTLSALGSCNNASDAMTLTLTPAPYVNAGADQVYCDQVADFNLNGAVSGITTNGYWTTTGTGTIANPSALNTTYTASAGDVAAGQMTFTLTSINNGNCAAVSDQMTIYLTAGIVVSAGPDQQVCVNSDHANLMGTVTNGSPSGTWSTTGTGTFEPSADVLNAQYYYSPADLANGAVVLTFTATNTGTCPSGSDQMTLTFGNSSFAYAGEDRTVCANSPIVQLHGNYSGGASGVQWSTSGTGSFSNNTDPNATYVLSSADIAAGAVQLTMTTITNGACSSVSDAITVTVNALPQILAGNDVIACTAAPVQLAAVASNATGGTWSTSGTGTFFDANALATLYYPSQMDSLIGTVILTVTTTGMDPCSAVSDQLVVTFGGGLSADAGDDVIACSTSPNVVLNGSVEGTTTGIWSTNGTGSFSPSATDLDATYIPGAADFMIGNINLILSTTNNQGCTPGRDTLVVYYHVPPTVNAGSDLMLCDGLQPVQLNGAAQNDSLVYWTTSGGGSFSPDAYAANAIYMPVEADSIAGGVHLVLTAFGTGGCPSRSDSLYIGVGPTRIADAGPDLDMCTDAGSIQLNGTITGVSGGTWSTNGSGSFVPDANALDATYVPSAPDLVFQQLRFVLSTTGNMGCAPGRDTLYVNLHQPPTVNAGADQLLCFGLESVQLAGSAQYASQVEWTTTGSGSFTPDAFTPGAVYMPTAADSIAGGVHLTLTAYGEGTCGQVTDALFLDIGPTRIAQAGTDMDVCADGSAFQLNGTIIGVSGGVWSTTGSGTFLPDATALHASYVPSTPDLVSGQLAFVLSTTGNMGCPPHSDTLYVNMHQPSTANAGADITTCDASAPVQLAGTFAGAPGMQWSTTGTGTFLPDVTTPDATYQPSPADSVMQQVFLVLTTSDDPFCAAAVDSLRLSFVNPLTPGFTFGNACAATPVSFEDASVTTSSPAIGWSWDFGDGASSSGQQVSHVFQAAGQYPVTLTVYAQNGCSATISQMVSVMDAPIAGFSYEGETFTEEEILFQDESSGATSWIYNFGDGHGSMDQNPVHTYTGPGQYIVVQTVSNAAGCTASDSLLIVITEDKVVPPKLPDAFSPNGDGVNDVFYVRGGPFVELHLRIYNGWGELVFETFDPEFGWDGTHNGKPEINGVYVYTVEAVAEDGREHSGSGKVTLIR